ncbi:MAG: PKD domain-containing protein, partial [Saprospiraceae bacterium]|nr:PKD domain-containing protein [Saprospiraceae bacterium]
MTSTDENPVVEYDTPGNYDVTLIVSNAAGADTVTFTDYIAVQTTPNPAFSAAVDQANVDFTNNSTGADAYAWDFGDGSTSSEENPTHVYTMDGTYTVTLSTENECGTTTTTQTIDIVTPTTA